MNGTTTMKHTILKTVSLAVMAALSVGSIASAQTEPLGGGFGKVFRIGKLPFNANAQAFSTVVRPDPGADRTLRLQIALLLPKSLFQ